VARRCHLVRTVFPRSAPAIRPVSTRKQSCCPTLDHVPRHGTSSVHLDVGYLPAFVKVGPLEVKHVDVLATRGTQRLYAEAKGGTAGGVAIFAGVVRDTAVVAAERLPPRIRATLGIHLFGVAENGEWTRSTPSGSGRGRPVGVIEDTEGPDQKVTLQAWLAARAHLVPPPTMRDSNGDSNALSPTVVGQRPLRREHAQNRRCGRLCWLLLINGSHLIVAAPTASATDSFRLRSSTLSMHSGAPLSHSSVALDCWHTLRERSPAPDG
jgi:hypothetical protein